jgi:excinuclease ABC subunit A
LQVVVDRFRFGTVEATRLSDAIESALRRGQGAVSIFAQAEHPQAIEQHWRYSSALECGECRIRYADPIPSHFSFNSPLGACETCRGFGRVIGVDLGLVIPDESRTLAQGAIKPWQTASFKECQTELVRYAGRIGVPLDVAWRELSAEHRHWVIEGANDWTLEAAMVRRPTVFRLARIESLQDAYPGATVTLSLLYPMHRLRRLATQARRSAVARRLPFARG